MKIENHVNGLDMESIRKVLELVERNQIPNSHFSDLECNLWSMVNSCIEHKRSREYVTELASDRYFYDADGNIYNGNGAVDHYEKETNCTCNNVHELELHYANFKYDFQMTYEELLRNGKKLLAIKLFRNRNKCGLREAKMYIDRMA